jgi:mRNA-degrading endonuclease RelE of RelBE toxin-antitoxin system
MLRVLQTRTFQKAYKKLTPNQRQAVDDAIRTVAGDPGVGQLKKGDLQGVRVHRFHMLGQLTLLGYRHDDAQLTVLLLAVGSHENFYRDLKRD